MKSISITKLLRSELLINNFTIFDRERIINNIFSYFLGFITYGKCYKFLAEYGISRDFSKFLRLLSEEEIRYIMFSLKVYAKYRHSDTVYITDKYWVRKLSDKLDYSLINITHYPKKDVVLNSIKPIAINISRNIYNDMKWDNSMSIDDFLNELLLKASQSYNLYIFSYRSQCQDFNKKVLYSCIIKSLKTRRLDMIGYTFKAKRIINMWASPPETNNQMVPDIGYAEAQNIDIKDFIYFIQNIDSDTNNNTIKQIA